MRKILLFRSIPLLTVKPFSEISYFGDNDLLLLQFRFGGNDSKNRSERYRYNKKLTLGFWSSFRLHY